MFDISSIGIRLSGTILFLTALFFFAFPFFVGIRHAGCIFGTVISFLGVVFFALNPFVSGVLQKIWENGFGHFVLCVLMGLLGFGAVLGIVFSVLMLRAAGNAPKEEHTVVILGCKVRGGAPSLMLQRRLDAALAYLEQHKNLPVIVCGGQGADESISEAQCMRDYLTAHGIPEEQIYLDDTSVSTLENMQNAKAILTEQDWPKEITVVTDGYHEYRSAKIAQGIGLKAYAVPAVTSWYLVPSYWVREWLGICYQFVFG